MMPTESEAKEDAQNILSAAVLGYDLIPGKVFRHYKGGLYTIQAVSVMQGTWETLVTYRSNKTLTDWTHTLAEFTKVMSYAANNPGGPCARFQPVYD